MTNWISDGEAGSAVRTKLNTIPNDGTNFGVAGVLAAANGGTGLSSLAAGIATFLGTPSSANLRSVLTDETGTGAAVFADTPTLITPNLGTPTSGTLTNCTLPIGGVTGLGTGVATFLATPSSANLRGALTDETGTGAAVFANTPTLVTPILGVATATSIAIAGGTLGSFALALTGQAIAENTTGTSPGWYSQITGDAVPRVRVGVNANDVASVGFGSGAATRDLFLERAGAATLRLGNVDGAAPVAQTISVQNVVAGTTNTAGAAFTHAGSQGTGTGAGGSLVFQVAPAGSTGSSQNALATALTIDSTKLATFTGGVTLSSSALSFSGNISAAAWGGATVASITGVRYKGAAASFTDTTSSGTVVIAATNIFGVGTILASSATTYTNYFNTYFADPVASTNVTMTNKWALGADSLKVGTTGFVTISTAGALIGASLDATSGGAFAAGFGSGAGGAFIASGYAFSWSSSSAGTSIYSGVKDTALTRIAAASIRAGQASSASPVAYAFTVGEASRGGTDSNIAGASGTLRLGGLGTGTGTVAPGIIQVGVLAASGTTQQAYGTAITVANTTATGLQFNGYGAGAITSDGSGNLTAASDPKLKNIQRQFTDGLSALQKIKPIVYKWKPDSGMESEHEYAGFDARNVRASLELATWEGKDGVLSLQDRALLAACVNAINELAARI